MAPCGRAGQSRAPLSCAATGRHASRVASARTLGVTRRGRRPMSVLKRIHAAYFALLFCAHVAAQPTLDIQGVRISVGDPRASVVARLLTASFRLSCLGPQASALLDCESLLVRSANANDALANVYFRDGKVRGIRKYWSRAFEGNDPSLFVQALHDVVAQLTRETGIPPTVSTAERRDPGMLQQSLVLTSGRRRVEIAYVQGLRGSDGAASPPFVNLSEVAE